MSIWGSQSVYGDTLTVADAAVDARVAFIRRTYAHLVGAVLALVGLEVVLFQSGVAQRIAETVLPMRFGWLGALVAFMVVGYIAERWARNGTSEGMQYAGLGVYVAAEALILVPLLYIAREYASPEVIPAAGITTVCVFSGLSAVVFVTKKDFSFLRSALSMGTLLAVGFIVCSMLFGWGGLSSLFAAGMAALMGGYVLYYTSQVMKHYRTDQHVAAALALFATIATMFWYILQLFMSRD